MAERTVLYRRDENLGIITLNRPERLNAINRDLLADLRLQLGAARHDKDTTAVVLTGAGRAFCSGEDLKETSAGKSLDDWTRETEGLQDIQRVILKLAKPLIAAVQGYAVGGGCEFAMSCDIRVAGEDAMFGFPETGLGMTLTTAGTKLLSQLVGLGKAKELILTGEFIGADEALRIGLVNRVVPTAAVLDEALDLARRIGARSPLALRLSRTAIDQGLHSSFEEVLEMEASHLLMCVEAESYKDRVENKLAEMGRR